ncbi:hypothetical protein GCM10023354_08970 [Garicola koreensis]
MLLQNVAEVIIDVVIESDLLNQGVGLEPELVEKAGVVDHVGGGIVLLFHMANVTRNRAQAVSATPQAAGRVAFCDPGGRTSCPL